MLATTEILSNPNTYFIFDVDGTLTSPAYPLTKDGYAFKQLKPYVFELISFLHKQKRLSIITSGLTGLPISQHIVDMINEKTHRNTQSKSDFDLMVEYINLEEYNGQPPRSRLDFVIEKFLEDPSRPVVVYGDSLQDYNDFRILQKLGNKLEFSGIYYLAAHDTFFSAMINHSSISPHNLLLHLIGLPKEEEKRRVEYENATKILEEKYGQQIKAVNQKK